MAFFFIDTEITYMGKDVEAGCMMFLGDTFHTALVSSKGTSGGLGCSGHQLMMRGETGGSWFWTFLRKEKVLSSDWETNTPIQKLQIVGLKLWRTSDLLGCSWSTPAEETMMEADAFSNLPELSALAGQVSVSTCAPDFPFCTEFLWFWTCIVCLLKVFMQSGSWTSRTNDYRPWLRFLAWRWEWHEILKFLNLGSWKIYGLWLLELAGWGILRADIYTPAPAKVEKH